MQKIHFCKEWISYFYFMNDLFILTLEKMLFITIYKQLLCSLFYSIKTSQEYKMHFFMCSLWLISELGLHDNSSVKWMREVQLFGGFLT